MIILKRRYYAGELLGMVVAVLMALGAVFVFSASANVGTDIDLQHFYEFSCLRQIVFFPLAVIVMYTASYIDYRRLSLAKGWLKNPITYLLVLSLVLLIIVLAQRFYPFLPKLVPRINRHYRWLRIPLGPAKISFQPSELAKWSLVFVLAGVCARLREGIRLYWKRFVPLCCLIGLVAALVIIEDFGTAALISLLGFLMLIIAGVKWWHILTPLPFAAMAFIAALVRYPSRMQRIWAFLDPEKWADSAAYQANQSLIALSSGGMWGKGLGRGICKYGHLPYDTTDFIFAIIGEELGFVGTTAVLGLFIAFAVLGVMVVVRCRDRFGRLLAGGIVLAIGVQAAINIGVVTVVLPTKGIPLPFVSAGGTCMLLSAAAVGVLLNIARQSVENPVQLEDA